MKTAFPKLQKRRDIYSEVVVRGKRPPLKGRRNLRSYDSATTMPLLMKACWETELAKRPDMSRICRMLRTQATELLQEDAFLNRTEDLARSSFTSLIRGLGSGGDFVSRSSTGRSSSIYKC